MLARAFFLDLLARVRHNWRLFVAITAPILLLFVAFAFEDPHAQSEKDPNKKFRTAYVIALMAVYWVLEVMPLAVTSLLPLVLFPLLDILDASTVSESYMRESNMIFLASIVLALAIEYCGLHIRVALRIISIFGSNPVHIMLGTMIVAAAMSMWLSDTSCTTMLLPILTALTAAMFQEEQEDMTKSNHHLEGANNQDEADTESAVGSINRRRRHSSVFANAAMQGHLGSVARRRSKRSDSIKLHTHTSNPLRSNQSNPSSPTSDDVPYPVSQVSPKNSPDDGPDRTKGAVNFSDRSEVVMSIIVEDDTTGGKTDSSSYGQVRTEPVRPVEAPGGIDLRMQENIRKMLLFSVAYSASIGGSGSLVGTGPIKIFKQLVKENLGKKSNAVAVTFATWMSFNIPTLTVNIAIVWLFLALRYMGYKFVFKRHINKGAERTRVLAYLKEEYKKLGPITSHEISVCVIFVIVVILWIFRDPQLFTGWSYYVGKKSGDSTAGMFGVMLLFVLPRNWSFLRCGGKGGYKPPGKYEVLLDWKFVSTNAPWGYVLLIGSGYAIAHASNESNLSHFIGAELDLLGSLSRPVLLLIVMCLTSLITEVVSNTACAGLILPVLFGVSCQLKMNPIFLTTASAVTSSYAFMLPISSPPNGIIFSTGELRIREMVTNGLFLNLVCNLVLYISILTWGEFIFKFSDENHMYCTNVTM